ncbi:hypothetical protein FD755_005898 [Muntiacus reevesi]|uniref:C-C motif chemokine n=1 Tax=Muntiacus reevesi TaxID=9886 RepID=A0A5J5MTY2_MUNRE|nr:hypothetical protein FD755_005898 [Muntiacus reevesi]
MQGPTHQHRHTHTHRLLTTDTHTHTPRAGNVGRECCLQFYKGSIPGKLLVDWYQTPGDCPNKAIVLVTRHGKNICANPNDKNVKRAMKYFQKHRKSPDLAV